MNSQSKRKKTGRSKDATAGSSSDPNRTGMPAVDSITGVDIFRKGKKIFRVIHTTEVDEYERMPPKRRLKER